MEEDRTKILHDWIRFLQWDENPSRTDAKLDVKVDVSVEGDLDTESGQKLMELSKADYVIFVSQLAQERAERFTIDAIRIELDGDTEDTFVHIYAEIHLAE